MNDIEVPVITIFVRHSAECPYRDDESWQRCNCRKHLRWTHHGQQFRRKAGTRSWAEAETIKRRIQDQLAGKKPEPHPAENVHTIRAAAKAFADEKEVASLAEESVKTYKRELNRFAKFCESEGVYTLDNLSPTLLTSYKKTWPLLYPSTGMRQMVQKRLSMFFRFCHFAGWMPRLIKMSPVRIDEPETMPLDDAEYEKLLSVVTPENFRHGSHKRIRALIQLMRWSGYAVRDASGVKREHFIKCEIDGKVYYQVGKKRQKIIAKEGQAKAAVVRVAIPEEVAEEVLAAANGDPQYIFWRPSGKVKDNRASSHRYGQQISKAFKLAGIECEGHMVSHRLRDTFACDLLAKDVPIEHVSKLLGHKSLATTEKHYAKWVHGRQNLLDRMVIATFTGHLAKRQRTRS